MATKKATAKSTDSTSTKATTNEVEARPIGEGKDPLAEGERLHNPTNTTAETHYEADDSELKAEEAASKIRGENADERAERHNAASSNQQLDDSSKPKTDVEAAKEADEALEADPLHEAANDAGREGR